jgi:hypothetical protein
LLKKKYFNSCEKEGRDQLRNGSKTFSDICVGLNLRPNIESLIEWGNWLTPQIKKKI